MAVSSTVFVKEALWVSKPMTLALTVTLSVAEPNRESHIRRGRFICGQDHPVLRLCLKPLLLEGKCVSSRGKQGNYISSRSYGEYGHSQSRGCIDRGY
jgi:hypothetical protein